MFVTFSSRGSTAAWTAHTAPAFPSTLRRTATCVTPQITTGFALHAIKVVLAYEMNGQPLPIDHGFPLRAVVRASIPLILQHKTCFDLTSSLGTWCRWRSKREMASQNLNVMRRKQQASAARKLCPPPLALTHAAARGSRATTSCTAPSPYLYNLNPVLTRVAVILRP
jgi:hypothetical protein